MGMERWNAVHADFTNTVGRSVSINTLKEQLRMLKAEFSQYDNLTKKSGDPSEKDDVMEDLRAYLETAKRRNVRVASFLSAPLLSFLFFLLLSSFLSSSSNLHPLSHLPQLLRDEEKKKEDDKAQVAQVVRDNAMKRMRERESGESSVLLSESEGPPPKKKRTSEPSASSTDEKKPVRRFEDPVVSFGHPLPLLPPPVWSLCFL